MVNGQRAFVRRSKVETLEAIINAEPPPLAAELPLPLKWCIERCIAKDPRDRYNSTIDLYHELRGIREHFPEATGAFSGPVPRRRAQKAAPSRMVQAAVLAGVLLAGAAASAVWLAPKGPDLGGHPFPAAGHRARIGGLGGMVAARRRGGVSRDGGRAQADFHAQPAISGRGAGNALSGELRPAFLVRGRQADLSAVQQRGLGGGRGGRRSQAGGDGRRSVRHFSRRQYPRIHPPQQATYRESRCGLRLLPGRIRSITRRRPTRAWTRAPACACCLRGTAIPFCCGDASSAAARNSGCCLTRPIRGKPRRVLESLQDAFPLRGFDWLARRQAPGPGRGAAAFGLPFSSVPGRFA